MSKQKPIMASFWQFDPTELEQEGGDGIEPQGATEVTAMPARLEVDRTDVDRVMVTVRGKPKGKRYEPADAVWLEIESTDALRLIEAMAKALSLPSPFANP